MDLAHAHAIVNKIPKYEGIIVDPPIHYFKNTNGFKVRFGQFEIEDYFQAVSFLEGSLFGRLHSLLEVEKI